MISIKLKAYVHLNHHYVFYRTDQYLRISFRLIHMETCGKRGGIGIRRKGKDGEVEEIIHHVWINFV